MVVNLTYGVNATLVVKHTRVLALLADTCEGAGTVAVHGALRLADGEGVALEAGRARADALVPAGPGDGILAAGVGVARVGDHRLLRRRAAALYQRIAHVARQAGAQRGVVPDLALRVLAAEAGTRVVAVVISACFVPGTVRVDHALGLALLVRVPEQPGRTRALTLVPNLAGDGPGPTRVGVTGVIDDWLS